MAQKIFKRIGLRRDRNFSDLRNSKGALNNLLDTIVDGSNYAGVPNTFISEDLDAIRNLFAEGMSNSNYRQFIGSAVEFTDANGQTRELKPNVTYQNRLDIFEEFSGTPRLRGGDGLTARYFNSDQIVDKKSTSIHALPVDDIFVGVTTGTELPSDQLWDTGEFEYTGKIHPSSVNANGGVKWEGFFIPTVTSKHQFSINSTGAFSFDFEDASYNNVGLNTYREYMRISGVTTSNCTADDAGNTLTLTNPDEARFIGVGMNVSSTIPSIIRSGTIVDAVSQSSGVITLINANGDAVTGSISAPITFKREIGDNASRTIITQVLERGRRYRIRARFYIPPDVNSQRVDRNITFHFSPFSTSDQDLVFTQLYNLNYDFSESAKGSFIDFLDNSVSFGGGTLGGTANSSEYVEVRSTKKIDIKYEPKTTFSAINIKTFSSAAYESGKTVITTNGNTTNMDVGNYVFGTGIQDDTRIEQIVTNEFIIVDKPVTSTSTGSQIDIIEHRGFVKKVPNCNNSSSGSLTSASSFANIETDMLVITSGSDVPAYTRVTQTVSDTQVRINHNSAFTGRDAYFYQSRGLINKSLDTFCVPAAGNTILCKLIDSDASSGTSEIILADITGVQTTQTVTGFGVQTGTTITGISGSTITLSLPLNANIKAGATVTVASAAEGDKSLCCPPTDTSPPFEPTNEGLKTTVNNPDLVINQGNLIFDTISAIVNASDYNFLRKDNAQSVTTNNFSLYDVDNGETAANFMMIHTGVDFSNPNSGTAYRILMQEVNV